MRLFALFCVSLRLYASSFGDIQPSSPDEIVSLHSGLLIDGYVSASSGQMVLSETDLCVRGAQDLCLKRTYVAPQILGCYEKKHKTDLIITGNALAQIKVKGWVMHPHLHAGFNWHSRYFQVRDPQGFVLEFEIQGNQGVLKSSSYGCSNLVGENPSSANDIRNIMLKVEDGQVKISWPEGTERHYSAQGASYFLQKEILPNGKAIYYKIDQGRLQIRSSDLTGKYTYASIAQIGPNQFVGSDGRKVDFVYEMKEVKGKSKENGYLVVKNSFQVLAKSKNPVWTSSSGYNEKTLLNFYDAQNYPVSCSYFERQNEPCRIESLSSPSGITTFSYDPPIPGAKEGSTTVTHPDGAKVVYRFNKLLLLAAIENWFEEKLINKKTFTYDHKQHIKSIETLDGEGNLLIAKQFECDAAGNATLEKTEGDFGVFCIKRQFDKNRLIFEEHDDGLQYAFTYLGDTRLVSSKTTLESGKKLRKTIYSYDDANNLIQIEEEGKTKTVYTLYQTAPHLHRIEWEEKSDWNNKLIHKIHYGYDLWGNSEREEHFGSDGKIAYTICRTYNEKGELLDETNPIGEKAVYQYDERGRCFYEEPISNGLVIGRSFDAKGRLKILTEGTHKTLFDYNASDELIEKTDYLGYTTKYHYDPVFGKPDRIEDSSSVTEIVYDAFGREKERIDPYKIKTIKTYNSYGDIATILHPEGGEESFDYYPNGLVKSYTDADGLVTFYVYDALHRTKEKIVGNNKTTYHYDGYNLKKIEDAENFDTTYEYDLVGRKIEEKRQNRKSLYGYDLLGFLASEEKSGRRIEYTNDLLGRVLHKSIDGVLVTSWTYDRGGNVSTIQQGGLTTFHYDAHDRLTRKIDAEENATEILYEIGPQVLLKTITDPMGVQTILTYNPQGQLLKKEVGGQVVEAFEYDKLFRLKKQDHLTFNYTPNGKIESIQEAGIRTTQWTYTPGDLLLTKEKPDKTVLLYEYDVQGRLEKVGSRAFQYDKLDRVIGGTGFSRTLDAFGNILREEWINGLWIESDYDDWDRPLTRRLPDQTRIEYSYEGPFLKKVTRVSKDGTEVYSHTYDDFDAKGNPRLSAGLFQTSYEYDQMGRKVGQGCPYFRETADYDARGNLIRKGDATYAYDSLSQMTSEQGRFTAKYDAHYNLQEINGQSIAINDLNQIVGFDYDSNGNLVRSGYAYDEFDQLIVSGGEASQYDALGRRIQKGKASFLYIGDEEIGAFAQGAAKELKVPGLVSPIAIEINQKPYFPVEDMQGSIRLLIDRDTAKIFKQNDCDAFGAGLSGEIPYAYAGKRYDADTGLLYFGKRYYDPSLRRWLTPDPIGPEDHSNLYQYVYNNPFRYQDPSGQFVIPLFTWAIGGSMAVCPLTWGVAAAIGVGYVACWSVQKMMDQGALSSGNVSASTFTGIMGPLSDALIQNYFDGNRCFYPTEFIHLAKKQDERRSPDEPGSPPYRGDKLGDDPTKRPTNGFEWRGKGKPESGRGTWYNEGTGERLYPDLNHPEGIDPHWDYHSPSFPGGSRLYLDGTWGYK